MKKLTALYEAQSVPDISRKLLSGSKTMEYVSKELKNIEGELERWAGKGNFKLDYIITDNHLYIYITDVKDKDKSEQIARARDLAYGYKVLSHGIKDNKMYLCWDLY